MFSRQWTVPQLSIMIIYNCAWSVLIQQIRIILSSDNLTQKKQKKAYFLFMINLITRSKKICRMGRRLKNCGTIYFYTCIALFNSLSKRGLLQFYGVPIQGSWVDCPKQLRQSVFLLFLLVPIHYHLDFMGGLEVADSGCSSETVSWTCGTDCIQLHNSVRAACMVCQFRDPT